MWWSVKNGLSKGADSSTDKQHDSSSARQTSEELPAQQSKQLRQMIQDIGADMSSMVDREREQVMVDFAKQARVWCQKDISHDLRTPLNAIIGFAQLMENGALGRIENPQYLEYLRHIRESGYDLLDKVEGLLEATPKPDVPAENYMVRSKKAASVEEAVA